jgi:sugar O-acyltransferase (sialic acid O-acetyltransferase NeuD family)
MNRLAVYGSGGHAKVVIDAAGLAGFDEIVVIDDDAARHGTLLLGRRVVGNRDTLLAMHPRPAVIVAIGDNRTRRAVADGLVARGLALATVIHPAALIGAGVALGAGSFVAGGVVINADARLGRNVIVNTAASVDHDCDIGDAVHIAPGCRLCGQVTVGDETLLGVAATVIPGVVIGRRALVAAGAVVTRDVADGDAVAGVPARPMKPSARHAA